jgi:hypothetical protein
MSKALQCAVAVQRTDASKTEKGLHWCESHPDAVKDFEVLSGAKIAF